jgi:putative ATP-dependent endonuclease of the OLD family
MHLSRLAVRGLRASAGHEIEVSVPGRFAVLLGANSAGKTTIADAAYLAHAKAFPRLPRPSAAGLGDGDRSVDVEYRFAEDPADEGPLGRQIQAQSGRNAPGTVAAAWTKSLHRELGKIATKSLVPSEHADAFRFVYLPAWRNPVDELGRREARILVELLRAQQQNLGKGRNLAGLRARASGLLEVLASDELIQALESRIGEHLRALSAGVTRTWPYVRGQVIDDAYLARVLELMLAVLEGRENARPLEVSGLGYVNLLHIAVTLAAIPDPALARPPQPGMVPTAEPAAAPAGAASDSPDGDAEPAAGDEAGELADADELVRQARAERDSEEDSFFPSAPFHVTVIIEEPEAHLHPQLQHSLARYLRRTVANRPELQVILSSHATDVITSCEPEDLVVLRRDHGGRPVSRTVTKIPFEDRDDVLRKTRLHMDASRSAALFADRLLLVEGVTDAALAREFGWVWADQDPDRQAFIDALSIVAVGTKVGPWPVRLLATRGHELCARVAVLRDSDLEFGEQPTQPGWSANHDPDVVLVEHSHPTLEPEVTRGNEELVGTALGDIGLSVPVVTPQSVHGLFRSARRAANSQSAVPAGPGGRRKGEFALALASRVAEARRQRGVSVTVPAPLERIFEFLYPAEPTASGPPAPPTDAMLESVLESSAAGVAGPEGAGEPAGAPGGGP